MLLACKDSPSALPFDDVKCVMTLIFEIFSSVVGIGHKRRVLARQRPQGYLLISGSVVWRVELAFYAYEIYVGGARRFSL